MMVSAQPAEPDESRQVRVARSVLDEMRALGPIPADAIASAILTIPSQTSRTPIPFEVPGDPPGTRYMAVLPVAVWIPAVIYRAALPDEEGKWRVVALLNRRAYEALTAEDAAERPIVWSVAKTVAAAGTVSLSGTGRLTVGSDGRPQGRPS